MKFPSSIFLMKSRLGMLILFAPNLFVSCLNFLFFTSCRRSQSVGDSLQIRTVVFANKSENINHLWLMDLNSSGIGYHARRLTNDAESENYPSWSPDGKRLAYQRDNNGSAI